jgi:hypothetical protein
LPDEEGNDVHVALGPTPDTQECASVTAEISPHNRPDSWNEIGHYEKFNSRTRMYVVDPAMATRLKSHSYRITGQLFLDTSHKVCACGINCSGDPSRASDWEIHPITNIEVCKADVGSDAANCDVNKDADWTSFHSWWKSLPALHFAQPHPHEPHEPPPAGRGRGVKP